MDWRQISDKVGFSHYRSRLTSNPDTPDLEESIMSKLALKLAIVNDTPANTSASALIVISAVASSDTMTPTMRRLPIYDNESAFRIEQNDVGRTALHLP
jgi:hypothetical protein